MRYHYIRDFSQKATKAEVYVCDHPVYSKCTLYRIEDRGLAVIQQKFDPKFKATIWKDIDACLVDAVYDQPGFIDFLDRNAACPDENGLYPTVTLRNIMWELRMKPLHRQRWETGFNRAIV